MDEETTHSSYYWKRDPLFWTYSILMFLPIVMVFVFYNYYSLDFLVYAGWILLVFSVVIILLAGGEFRKKGGAPKGKSIVHTTVLVDSGVYAVIRHPQYLGFILFILALVLMSQHWLSAISGVLISALFYRDVLREEQMSVEKFGDDYKRYMEKGPEDEFSNRHPTTIATEKKAVSSARYIERNRSRQLVNVNKERGTCGTPY